MQLPFTGGGSELSGRFFTHKSGAWAEKTKQLGAGPAGPLFSLLSVSLFSFSSLSLFISLSFPLHPCFCLHVGCRVTMCQSKAPRASVQRETYRSCLAFPYAPPRGHRAEPATLSTQDSATKTCIRGWRLDSPSMEDHHRMCRKVLSLPLTSWPIPAPPHSPVLAPPDPVLPPLASPPLLFSHWREFTSSSCPEGANEDVPTREKGQLVWLQRPPLHTHDCFPPAAGPPSHVDRTATQGEDGLGKFP